MQLVHLLNDISLYEKLRNISLLQLFPVNLDILIVTGVDNIYKTMKLQPII